MHGGIGNGAIREPKNFEPVTMLGDSRDPRVAHERAPVQQKAFNLRRQLVKMQAVRINNREVKNGTVNFKVTIGTH